MNDFDFILRKSLAAVNEGYEQALSDLFEIVEEVDASLKTNVGEEFAFVAVEYELSMKSAIYTVSLDTNSDDRGAPYIPVVSMRIPSSGYPMETGSVQKSTGNFTPDGIALKDRSEIKVFFASQLEDPNSLMIQAIGFALRKKAAR